MSETFWEKLQSGADKLATKDYDPATIKRNEEARYIDPTGRMTPEEMKVAQKQMAEDAKYMKYDDKNFDSEDLATGGYNVLNSALFGIPDVIVKSTDSDAYKKLQAMRERNKTASLIGDIGGALIPSTGLIASGIGKGAKLASGALKAGKGAETASKIAKGADVAGDFLKGTGKFAEARGLKAIAQGAGRGAIESGLQTVPRVLSGEGTGKDALLGIGLGGAIGAGVSALPSILRSSGTLNKGESFTKPLQDSLVNKELAARGISGTDIKKAMNETARTFGLNKVGNSVNNADDVKQSLLKVFKDNDILNADEAQAFIQGTGQKFEKLNKLFDSAGVKVSSLTDDIMTDPAIQAFIEEHGDDGVKAVKDLITKLDKKNGLTAIKQSLYGEMKFANKSTDRLQSEMGDVAHAIKNKLEDTVLELDPLYPEYKADWKAIQPLRQFVAREKMGISKAYGGSDTAAKQIATSALGSNVKGMLGGALGANAGLIGFDPNDPTTYAPSALKAIGGLALGTQLNRLAPAVANYTSGQIAGMLNKPEVLSRLAKAGVILTKANIPAIAERLAGQLSTEETPQETREKIGEIQPMEKVIEKRKAGGFLPPEAETEEVSTEPDAQIEEKKNKYGEAYTNKLETQMQNYWAENFSDTMDFEDYKKLVSEKTDGFNPRKTASFLYPDKSSRNKFLRDLDVSEKLSNLNLDETYAKDKFLEDKDVRSKRAMDRQNLIDTVASLVTSEGQVPSKLTTDTIQADIKLIADSPLSPAQKRSALMSKLSEKYGLGLDELQQLGLA